MTIKKISPLSFFNIFLLFIVNNNLAALSETGRLTNERLKLSDTQLEELNAKLCYIQERLDDEPPVTITYFQEDGRKAGGAYLDYSGTVKRIDDYEYTVVMSDGKEILIDDIVEVERPIFPELEYQSENRIAISHLRFGGLIFRFFFTFSFLLSNA
ncbi:MAG: YolD-like family protein [Lachnospiraceae bacterium]|nr:YolD-like family protein [Lachnospiraceae bacterium]